MPTDPNEILLVKQAKKLIIKYVAEAQRHLSHNNYVLLRRETSPEEREKINTILSALKHVIDGCVNIRRNDSRKLFPESAIGVVCQALSLHTAIKGKKYSSGYLQVYASYNTLYNFLITLTKDGARRAEIDASPYAIEWENLTAALTEGNKTDCYFLRETATTLLVNMNQLHAKEQNWLAEIAANGGKAPPTLESLQQTIDEQGKKNGENHEQVMGALYNIANQLDANHAQAQESLSGLARQDSLGKATEQIKRKLCKHDQNSKKLVEEISQDVCDRLTSTPRKGDPFSDTHAAAELLRDLARKIQTAKHVSNHEAVRMILTAAEGDYLYKPCERMQQIIRHHGWNESYVFKLGKPSGAHQHTEGVSSSRSLQSRRKKARTHSELTDISLGQSGQSANIANNICRFR